MNEETSNDKHTVLAVMEGELAAITVKEASAAEDLVVYVPSGAMTARAVAALRMAFPTNQIWEKGSRPGLVVHAVQTKQDFDAPQATHSRDGSEK